MYNLLLLADFNPRSREGSDHDPVSNAGALYISIHAPVKGATCIVPPLL